MVQGNSHSHSLLVGKELGANFLEGSLVTGIKNHKIVPTLKTPAILLLEIGPKEIMMAGHKDLAIVNFTQHCF